MAPPSRGDFAGAAGTGVQLVLAPPRAHNSVDLLDNDRVRPFLHDADRTSGDRVLHVAARRADATTVVALLRRRADGRSANIDDETPLGSALSWYAKKLSAARDLAGVMAGRPDLHLRAVAEGRRPPPARPGRADARGGERRDARAPPRLAAGGGRVAPRGGGHDGARPPRRRAVRARRCELPVARPAARRAAAVHAAAQGHGRGAARRCD